MGLVISGELIMDRIFPYIMIILMLCSSGVYGYYGNWRMMLYWLCGAGLNICVLLGDK